MVYVPCVFSFRLKKLPAWETLYSKPFWTSRSVGNMLGRNTKSYFAQDQMKLNLVMTVLNEEASNLIFDSAYKYAQSKRTCKDSIFVVLCSLVSFLYQYHSCVFVPCGGRKIDRSDETKLCKDEYSNIVIVLNDLQRS